MNNDQYSSIMERLGDIQGDIGKLSGEFGQHKHRLGNVDQRLAAVEARQNRGYAELDQVRADVREHGGKLERLERAGNRQAGALAFVMGLGGAFAFVVDHWDKLLGKN